MIGLWSRDSRLGFNELRDPLGVPDRKCASQIVRDFGITRYILPFPHVEKMKSVATVSKQRSALRKRSDNSHLSLEEEVLSLHAIAPSTLSQLPVLFAESVVDSASKILGEATGEALLRYIGDSELRDPEAVYSRLNSFLRGGSDDMRRAIAKTFTSKVHTLYLITIEIAQPP